MTSGRAAGGGIRVDGLRRLRRDLKRVVGKLDDLKLANAKALAVVVPAAQARAPRRTGALAGSLRGNKSASRATVSAGGARLPYAGPIHWGWPARQIEAQPFIADAAVATEPAWLPAYEADVQAAVDLVNGNTY